VPEPVTDEAGNPTGGIVNVAYTAVLWEGDEDSGVRSPAPSFHRSETLRWIPDNEVEDNDNDDDDDAIDAMDADEDALFTDDDDDENETGEITEDYEEDDEGEDANEDDAFSEGQGNS